MQFISTFLKQVQRVLNTTQSTTPRQAASGSWRFSLSQGWLVMLLPVLLLPVVLVLTSCGDTPVVDAPAADLSISTPSTVSTVLFPGSEIDFEVTVTNQGTIDADSFTLSYYRSADDRLYGGDVRVGTDIQQPRLAASAIFYGASNITIPADLPDDIYYYYACVNRVATEINLINNCSDAVPIRIATMPIPDLNLSSTPSATPSSLFKGASFEFSITVRNTGTGEADSTLLRVYHFAGDSPDPDNDDEVGTNTLSVLAAGATFASSSTIVAPDAAGTYQYYACVDEVAEESDTDNNCSASVQITVTAPDLVVQSFEATPDVIGSGETLSFSVVVKNSGDGNAASGGTFILYQSTVANFTSGDTLDPGVTLPAINPGSSSPSQTFTLGAPAVGTYYYGVCVFHSDDGDKSNDCSAAAEVQVVNTARAISAGTMHTCAVDSDGAAKCWGYNSDGALGDGSSIERHEPTQVMGLGSGVAAISAGQFHTCAIYNGAARCWGYNNRGMLGDGSVTTSDIPVQVSGLDSNVTAISAGNDHTCAVQGGEAKCWGYNNNGQLGDGSNTTSSIPVVVAQTPADVSDPLNPIAAVPLGSGVTDISVGNFYSCAVQGGEAKCWGHNGNGRLGDGTNTPSLVPVQVAGLDSGVTAISAGQSHTCAVHNGAAHCWGYNIDGRLGDGTNTNSNVPTDVMGLGSGVTAISAGWGHTCVIIAGAARCWGYNPNGQLGDSSTINSNSPVQVMGLDSGVTAISAGVGEYTCALHLGVAKCWGSNSNGRLGDGSTTSSNTPVPVLLK